MRCEMCNHWFWRSKPKWEGLCKRCHERCLQELKRLADDGGMTAGVKVRSHDVPAMHQLTRLGFVSPAPDEFRFTDKGVDIASRALPLMPLPESIGERAPCACGIGNELNWTHAKDCPFRAEMIRELDSVGEALGLEIEAGEQRAKSVHIMVAVYRETQSSVT